MLVEMRSRVRWSMQSLRLAWEGRSKGLLSFGSLTVVALPLSMLALAPVGLAPKRETATPRGPQEVVSLRTARSETFVDEDGTYHTNTYTRSRDDRRQEGVHREESASRDRTPKRRRIGQDNGESLVSIRETGPKRPARKSPIARLYELREERIRQVRRGSRQHHGRQEARFWEFVPQAGKTPGRSSQTE